MNRRAALQLRLQQMVEGLSVVAISYYAVSLMGYILAPISQHLNADEAQVQAIVAIPVIGAVWWMVRRLRMRVSERT